MGVVRVHHLEGPHRIGQQPVKRTPLKRKTRMRTRRLKPRQRRRSDPPGRHAWRVVNAWRDVVRASACLWAPHGGCSGGIEAAHVRAGNLGGTSLKPPDSLLIPLCNGHHRLQHAGHRPDKDDCANLWSAFITRHIGYVPEGEAEHRRACEELRAIGERRIAF